jgi:hypothetical protein
LLGLLKANSISVSDIVKTEFLHNAHARGKIKFVEGAAAPDAVLSLAINVQGLGRSHLLGGQLPPVLNITATLKRPNGTVIWQKSDFNSATNQENNKTAEFDAYMKNPELLRAAFTHAASILTRWVAEKLPS